MLELYRNRRKSIHTVNCVQLGSSVCPYLLWLIAFMRIVLFFQCVFAPNVIILVNNWRHFVSNIFDVQRIIELILATPISCKKKLIHVICCISNIINNLYIEYPNLNICLFTRKFRKVTIFSEKRSKIHLFAIQLPGEYNYG